MPLPELLTVTEAAEALRLSYFTVLNRIKAGALPHIRMGNKYFVEAKELKKFVAKSKQ